LIHGMVVPRDQRKHLWLLVRASSRERWRHSTPFTYSALVDWPNSLKTVNSPLPLFYRPECTD